MALLALRETFPVAGRFLSAAGLSPQDSVLKGSDDLTDRSRPFIRAICFGLSFPGDPPERLIPRDVFGVFVRDLKSQLEVNGSLVAVSEAIFVRPSPCWI